MTMTLTMMPSKGRVEKRINTRSEWRPVVLWSIIESEMYFADYSVLFSLSRFHMLSSMFE